MKEIKTDNIEIERQIRWREYWKPQHAFVSLFLWMLGLDTMPPYNYYCHLCGGKLRREVFTTFAAETYKNLAHCSKCKTTFKLDDIPKPLPEELRAHLDMPLIPKLENNEPYTGWF